MVPPTDSTGAVEVKCTCTGLDCLAFGYTIEIGAGASGSVSDRRLRRAGESSDGLKYQLFRDATRLFPWDTGANKASVLYLLNLFGSWQSTTVYGRVLAGQTVASGAYSDSPAVLISY